MASIKETFSWEDAEGGIGKIKIMSQAANGTPTPPSSTYLRFGILAHLNLRGLIKNAQVIYFMPSKDSLSAGNNQNITIALFKIPKRPGCTHFSPHASQLPCDAVTHTQTMPLRALCARPPQAPWGGWSFMLEGVYSPDTIWGRREHRSVKKSWERVC